jgi:hypothetical protein
MATPNYSVRQQLASRNLPQMPADPHDSSPSWPRFREFKACQCTLKLESCPDQSSRIEESYGVESTFKGELRDWQHLEVLLSHRRRRDLSLSIPHKRKTRKVSRLISTSELNGKMKSYTLEYEWRLPANIPVRPGNSIISIRLPSTTESMLSAQAKAV